MGMSTRIGRKITVTTCNCIVMEGKDVTSKSVDLYGEYNDVTRATNACRKALGTQQVLVESVSHRSAYYSMPIKTFVENADQVTEKELFESNESED